MGSSNGFVNLERANPRPIELHRSALTEEEYDYFIDTLSELLPQTGGIPSHEPMVKLDTSMDIALESKVVTLREARAWLRGRFQSVPCEMVDEIMRLFPSPLTGDKELTGAQFFAALRLMFHAENEMTKLDKTLTFKPAQMTFAISSGITDSAEDTASKANAPSSVEASQNEEASESTHIQCLAEKRNEKAISSETVPASPNKLTATIPKKAEASIKAPSKKIMPEKRSIDVESEDEDADGKKEDTVKKDAKSAPRTQLKLQSTGLPAQKARRTNAGKRKSDATWQETAARDGGEATGARKPTPGFLPATANKTANQLSIKKPMQYAAPVPMPANTRVIKPPCVPRSQRNEAEPQEEEEESGSQTDAGGSDSEPQPEPQPQPKAKSKPNLNAKLKPMPKATLKSKRGDHDSDDDPNKTKSDINRDGSDSDSQNEDANTGRKKQKTMIPSPSVARRTGKTTIGKNTGSTSARGRNGPGPKGGRISSDGYPRPPPRNGLYTVSDITGSRTSTTGAVELHVSWKGYPPSESSWEPLASVEHTDAYARWKAMWARLEKKGLRNVQIVHNMKKTVPVNGKNQEQKMLQEVGTPVKEAKWVPTKEAKAMIARIKQAIDDNRNG